jgi:hypothetical protein
MQDTAAREFLYDKPFRRKEQDNGTDVSSFNTYKRDQHRSKTTNEMQFRVAWFKGQ